VSVDTIYAVAAGVTHFALEQEYSNTYPPTKNAGVAELLGRPALLEGGCPLDVFALIWFTSPDIVTWAGLSSDSAAGLFLLTLAVTPANIYMYTHGAKLPMDGPEVPVVGHAIRGVMQIILLGLLYQMGEGTFNGLFHSN
jgi:uncharacterized membrane protein